MFLYLLQMYIEKIKNATIFKKSFIVRGVLTPLTPLRVAKSESFGLLSYTAPRFACRYIR